jgi:ParB family chromosome partitioning protein
MRQVLTESERILGERPGVTLVVENGQVVEIWVEGRAPRITLRDCDWVQAGLAPEIDPEGFRYSSIQWSGPAWALGLSLYPPRTIP